MRDDEPTHLFRALDETGALLYVGITRDLMEHWRTYWYVRAWAKATRKLVVATYPNRTLARRAETAAIREEHPMFNIFRSVR